MLKAVPWGTMPGYYDLPGGRINKTELRTPLVRLLRRELREELGSGAKCIIYETPVAVGRHVWFSKKLNKKFPVIWIMFEAKYLAGPIKVSDEHLGYQWKKINKKNMATYFTKGALQVIKNYLTNKLD